MSSSLQEILRAVTLTSVSEFLPTFSLIFGGCCSNALALEQLTNTHPNAGSLISFAQFLCAALYGLPRFVALTPYPRLRPRRVPLLPYLAQVVLFYVITLLNNAAFAYRIPMTVHIIFRSGGLVVSLLMGWLFLGRRYTWTQLVSVLVVSAGVVLTTFSAAHPRSASPKAAAPASDADTAAYAVGISLLALALVCSGLLGIVQDKTYARYGHAARAQKTARAKGGEDEDEDEDEDIEPWQESMFYLHFLGLPMFVSVRHDLAAQIRALAAAPALPLRLPVALAGPRTETLHVPVAFLELALSTATALLCAAGVHRLAARVSSLTVVLALVVRKAASLVVSVVLFQPRMDARAQAMLWGGAALVFAGTVAYSRGTGWEQRREKEKED